MISPARVFAAMTAHPINHRNVGRSTALPDFDQATAAAMCAGMPDLQFKASMLKWAGDWSNANYLEYRIWIAAVDIAREEKWKIPRGREYLRRMAGLAIAEVADPGRWQLDKDRAEFIGMHKSEFCRVWRKRYEMVYRILDELAQDGYRHVQRNNMEIAS
ncbi:MAG: hypothetical protein KZQ94_16015 [Candidatus Thiodiazotropha sp. (ex Troendleina suluensis)]|nr:hypothetical protein [Candidatus Thiodiazotropha sp. (ex Troendleina suluensis)]